jgi:hypothetical protein
MVIAVFSVIPLNKQKNRYSDHQRYPHKYPGIDFCITHLDLSPLKHGITHGDGL